MKLLAILASATAATAAAVAPRLNARQDPGLPDPTDPNTKFPQSTWRRWVATGEMKLDPQDQPIVVRNGNANDETSGIVSFQFDEDTRGKKCELHFLLRADRDLSEGSQRMDVFTYNNLPETLSTFADVKERDIHVGRVYAPLDQEAEWEESSHGYPVIDCPAGETIGIEYVANGESLELRWDIGATGPWFYVLDEE